MVTSSRNYHVRFGFAMAIFLTYTCLIKTAFVLALVQSLQDTTTSTRFNIHFTHVDENGIISLPEDASKNLILGLIEIEGAVSDLENADCVTDSEHVVARRAGNMLFKIELGERVDRENQSEFEVAIACSSHGNTHRTTQTFAVRVVDANDNPPVFVLPVYNVNVTEGVSVGRFIVRMNAHDVDLGRNSKFKYSLSELGDSNNGSFKIDPDNGDIVTNGVIDREAVPVYTLTVLATDEGVPPMTGTALVVITVNDVNDNAPVIQVKELHVRENQPDRSIVGTIRAVDDDTGSNAEIFFMKFDADDASTEPFILKSNGEVLTTERLDREKISNYSLVVAVKDKGSPQQSSTSTVTIIVDDANDNAPEVTSPCLSYQESFVVEADNPGDMNTSGYVVIDKYCPQNDTGFFQVVAEDKDTQENAALVFSLDSVDGGRHHASQDELFKINDSSGVISLQRCAYQGEGLVNILRVRVSDSGVPRKSVVCLLNVTLDVDPQQLPNFMNSGDSRFSLVKVVSLLLFLLLFFPNFKS